MIKPHELETSRRSWSGRADSKILGSAAFGPAHHQTNAPATAPKMELSVSGKKAAADLATMRRYRSVRARHPSPSPLSPEECYAQSVGRPRLSSTAGVCSLD